MSPFTLIRRRGSVILSLVVAAELARAMAGCSLPGSEGATETPAWSDSAADGFRSIPAAVSEAETSAQQSGRKPPFWEKYRDKRVGQINEHLSVQEPSGW